MNWLRSRIRRSPKAALVLGKTVFLAGAILIVGAVFARAGLMAANEERVAAKLPAFQTLGQAYPQYPTWLVPEGPVGFSIAAVLTLVGMAMTVLASDALKGRGRGAA
jgi:hypothetical protein